MKLIGTLLLWAALIPLLLCLAVISALLRPVRV